ncbi:MAG: rRNA maturation RNase YbeY [Bacilli bacterium]|nr:rRNA maturation RNase YbeY [Bacilli bacterium]
MFEIINDTNYKIENLDTLNNYLNFLVKKRNLEDAIFNIIFVTSEKIHEINKEYRNVDRVTDVISFALEDSIEGYVEEIRMLGDIYICVEKMKEQAELYNHSVLREMCFLTTHGLLHLLGYDHMEEDDEKVMFSLQEELLNEYGIKR